MPILIFQDEQGTRRAKAFVNTIVIGADPMRPGETGYQALRLPAAAGLSTRHAVVKREERTKIPVLVDLAGRQLTGVNRIPILHLKTLVHGDYIVLGAITTLQFREILISRLSRESSETDKDCPLCLEPLLEGQEVVVCPRSPASLHRHCWFASESCPVLGCDYPNYTVVMDALLKHTEEQREQVRFEQLEEPSPLLRNRHCAANTQRDGVPFQERNLVAHCPRCDAPYHLRCWLELPLCTCGYNIHQLLDEVFQFPTGVIHES